MSTFALSDPQLNALLDKLHNESESQNYSLLAFSVVRSVLESIGLKWFVPGSAWYDSFYRSKYVALERDKANFCYLLIRALNAKTVVECGTSFGVSTIYLAAGVRDNSHEERGVVIATENEAEKIVKARETWEKAGLSGYIKLLKGDIRTTLKDVHLDDPVEFVLMDIWTPLALPSLKNLLPKMKKGCVLVTDNTAAARSKAGYAEYLAFIRNEKNHFRTMTTPFHDGFEISVYLP